MAHKLGPLSLVLCILSRYPSIISSVNAKSTLRKNAQLIYDICTYEQLMSLAHTASARDRACLVGEQIEVFPPNTMADVDSTQLVPSSPDDAHVDINEEDESKVLSFLLSSVLSSLNVSGDHAHEAAGGGNGT
jgi:hypothetical protein